jgi:hypothetical protein
MEAVQSLFEPYEARFVEYWLDAWKRWVESPQSKTFIYKRTRANDIFDFAMQRAIPDMEATPGVAVRKRHDTAYFGFQSKLFVRMKKGDERGLGRNYRTQMNLAIVQMGETVPLFDDTPWKIEVTYKLNMLETQIEEILVVARHEDDVLWHYPIYRADGSLDELPAPPKLPVSPPPPPAAQDVVSVPGKEEVKKKEEER